MPSGSRRNSTAAVARLEDRSEEVLEGERARRLGEIDCAVGEFGDIRAELQRPPVDLGDQRLDRAGGRIERQQAARSCRRPTTGRRGRHASPAVGCRSRRRPTGAPPSGRDAHDRAVDQAGPDLAVAVDDDVLGRIAGHRRRRSDPPTENPGADRPAAASSGRGRSAAYALWTAPVDRSRGVRVAGWLRRARRAGSRRSRRTRSAR